MTVPAALHGLQRRWRAAWGARGIKLKAASFALIGLVNTVVDYAIFLFAYYLLELPLIPANVLAWAIAVSGSYVMNSFITFAAESGRRLNWRAYGAFVASGIAGVFVNTATLVICSWWLPVPAAKLFAVLASFAVNFTLSHFVVFRRRAQSGEQ
ncbi:MAG: GtrA family protein [Xanthobacteraceae bacterium]